MLFHYVGLEFRKKVTEVYLFEEIVYLPFVITTFFSFFPVSATYFEFEFKILILHIKNLA